MEVSSRQPGDQHLAARGSRRGNANDQAGGGDDAVVRAQNGGAQPADAFRAVTFEMTGAHCGSFFERGARRSVARKAASI
jgi:hypothetical protein